MQYKIILNIIKISILPQTIHSFMQSQSKFQQELIW